MKANKITFTAFIILLVCWQALYCQVPSVKVSPSEKYIELNTVGEVFVSVENIIGCRAYSVKLSYDSQKLRCLNVTRATFFSNWNTFFFATIDSNASIINVDEAILGLGHESGSGDLFKVEFLGIAEGDVNLSFINADFRDTLNNQIQVQTQEGILHVVNPTNVESDPVYAENVSIQAYPNPFNSSTRIKFSSAIDEMVEFSIFSISGERVYFSELQSQGNKEIFFIWNGTDMSGKVLPSGIYFISAITKSEIKNFKLIILK